MLLGLDKLVDQAAFAARSQWTTVVSSLRMTALGAIMLLTAGFLALIGIVVMLAALFFFLREQYGIIPALLAEGGIMIVAALVMAGIAWQCWSKEPTPPAASKNPGSTRDDARRAALVDPRGASSAPAPSITESIAETARQHPWLVGSAVFATLAFAGPGRIAKWGLRASSSVGAAAAVYKSLRQISK